LLVTSHGALNALMLSWLEDLADPDFPFSAPIRAYSDDEVRSRHEVVRCQLDSLSRGLLEMRGISSYNKHDSGNFLMASKDIYFEQKVDFFHRTVREYLRDPERLAIIKQRLGKQFDVVEAIQRLRLAEFKFLRTMKDYFKAQGLGQTSMVASFYSAFYVEGFQYTPRFLDEYDRVLEHHRRTPFSYPAETSDNTGLIAWSQWWDTTEGSATLSGNDFLYIQWVANCGHHEYVMGRVLADRNLILPRNGVSLLFTVSNDPSKLQLTRDLLKAGVTPNEQITVRYADNYDPDLHQHCRYSTQVTTVWAAFLFILAQRLVHEHPHKRWDDEGNVKMFLIVEEFFRSGADCNAYFLLQGKDKMEANGEKAEASTNDTEEVRGGGGGGGDLTFVSLEDFILQNRPPNMDVLTKHILGRKGTGLWQGTRQAVATALSLWMGEAHRDEWKYRRAQVGSLDSMKGSYVVKTACVNGRRLERGFSAGRF
jgi:hypothetical protein